MNQEAYAAWEAEKDGACEHWTNYVKVGVNISSIRENAEDFSQL